MKKTFLTVAALLLAGATGHATEPPPMNAGELAHALDRVGTTARVLYVAAHPDDENTRLLGYLANNRHLVVAYLSMTRGGGGQNLIGREQSQLLDVIRTQELLAARRLDGAQQRFSGARDFGYSKSAAETFSKWGHDEALGDVVWIIRTFQPDVVITRFSEQPPNHGHHTASAILAREAFAAAADPQRFPEQLKDGVVPWKATRLLQNIPGWRDAPPPPKEAIALDVGVYDARLGLGYGELAALSRSQHKSQGFGVPGDRGPQIERFLPLGGTPPTVDLLDGVELGWGRFGPAAAPLTKALDEARAALDRDHPERALPALARAHAALDALPDVPRVRDARRELARVIAGAAGVFVRATAAAPVAVPGGGVEVSVELVARSPAAVTLRRVELTGSASASVDVGEKLGPKRVVALKATLPAEAPLSVPYWLEQPLPGRYPVRVQALVGRPENPPALEAGVEIVVADRAVRLGAPVVFAWTDPVQGERVRDVLVAPPVTVTPARDAVLFPNGRAAPVLLRVRASIDGAKTDVELGLPVGWRASPPTQEVALAKAGDEATLRFDVTPPTGAVAPVEVHPTVGGRHFVAFREDVIDHPHIPLQLVLQPASVRLVPLALRLPAGLVGYVPGSGDSVAEDLAHVGVKVAEIDEATLRSGDLGRFAAIVVGIRAYNTREVVRAAHERLMAYVEKGGTVLVQYNTNSGAGPLSASLGPFPLEIGRDRVTDENAAVKPVDPQSPLLRAPNAITAADFEGWVQERGIYFGAKWDPRYQPLFEIADFDEPASRGAVLVARHGKGRYVYTGLAFFRQLPAGVPGAYRLFVNLISGAK